VGCGLQRATAVGGAAAYGAGPRWAEEACSAGRSCATLDGDLQHESTACVVGRRAPRRPGRSTLPPLQARQALCGECSASLWFWHFIEQEVGDHVALLCSCSPSRAGDAEGDHYPQGGVQLNAYMLHNLAHVELNAIDLAWDTVVWFLPLRDTLGMASSQISLAWPVTRAATFGCTRSG